MHASDALDELAGYIGSAEEEDRDRLAPALDCIGQLVAIATDVLESELEIRNGNAAGDWPSLVTELAALFGREAEFEDELEDEDETPVYDALGRDQFECRDPECGHARIEED